VSNLEKPVVLIVEDEPLIRWNAVDILGQAGWQPLEAADADAALTILAQNPSVTVLFTDVNMPGVINGLELAEQVHLSHPAIQIVITSGKGTVSANRIPRHGTFLPKPYDLDDLVKVLAAKVT